MYALTKLSIFIFILAVIYLVHEIVLYVIAAVQAYRTGAPITLKYGVKRLIPIWLSVAYIFLTIFTGFNWF